MTSLRNTVSIKINGEPRPLRLTLGALADIEDAFGGDIETMKARLLNPRVGDVLTILHALLAGGGASLTVEALKASDVDIAEAAAAIAEAFKALGDGSPGKSSSGAA